MRRGFKVLDPIKLAQVHGEQTELYMGHAKKALFRSCEFLSWGAIIQDGLPAGGMMSADVFIEK